MIQFLFEEILFAFLHVAKKCEISLKSRNNRIQFKTFFGILKKEFSTFSIFFFKLFFFNFHLFFFFLINFFLKWNKFKFRYLKLHLSMKKILKLNILIFIFLFYSFDFFFLFIFLFLLFFSFYNLWNHHPLVVYFRIVYVFNN